MKPKPKHAKTAEFNRMGFTMEVNTTIDSAQRAGDQRGHGRRGGAPRSGEPTRRAEPRRAR